MVFGSNLLDFLRHSRVLILGPFWAIGAMAGLAQATSSPQAQKFEYERSAGAESCPEADVVRGEIEARLGYSPFRDDAKKTLRATIAPSGGSLRARVELLNEQGQLISQRELRSASGDCEQLIQALAVTVGLSLDPLAVPAGARPSSSAPTPAASSGQDLRTASGTDSAPPILPRLPPPVSSQPPILADRTPPVPQWLQLRGGVFASQGMVPSTTPGFAAQLRWERHPWSIGAEARVDMLASSQIDTSQEARAALVAGSLIPCFHVRAVHACVTILAGSLQTEGLGLDAPRRDRAVRMGLGPRVGLQLPLGGTFFVAPYAEGLAMLTRTTIIADQQPIWVSPPLAFRAGLDLGLRFGLNSYASRP